MVNRPKKYAYVPLVNATEVHRRFDREVQTPGLLSIENAYISRSDGAITLRPDLDVSADKIPQVSQYWEPTVATKTDYLNSVSGTYGSDGLVYFTNYAPCVSGSSPQASDVNGTPMISSYGEGTVGTGGAALTTVTGVDTEWLRNVWQGCMLKVAGSASLYRIESVPSDTSITIDPAATITDGAGYTILRTHNSAIDGYKYNVQQYGTGLMYSTPRIEPTADGSWISGPFYGKGQASGTTITFSEESVIHATRVESAYSSKFRRTNAAAEVVLYNNISKTNYSKACVHAPGKAGAWDTIEVAPAWANDDSTGGMCLGNGSKNFFIYYDKSTYDFECWTHGVDLDTAPTKVGTISSGTAPVSGRGVGGMGGIAWDGNVTMLAYVIETSSLVSMGKTFISIDNGANWESWATYSGETDWSRKAHSTFNDSGPRSITTYPTYCGDRFVMFAGRADENSDGELNYKTAIIEYDTATTTQTLVAFQSGLISREPYWDGTFLWAPIFTDGNDSFKYLVGGLTADDIKVLESLGGAIYGITGDGTSVYAVTRSSFIKSFDGADNWEILYSAGLDEQFGDIHFDGTSTLITKADTTNNTSKLYSHTETVVVEEWNTFEFNPISDKYRAATASALNGYLVMFNTRELSDESGEWTYHPRRFRWSAPGTWNYFDDTSSITGSGWGDLTGVGTILDSKPVNGRIITFESSQIGALSPRGYVATPWEYEVIEENIRIVSNPVVVGDVCYFIADDGLLWGTNGIDVFNIGNVSFDITPHDDFTIIKPIWLDYWPRISSLVAYYAGSSDRKCFFIEPQSNAVSSVKLPKFTVSGTDYYPLNVSSIFQSGDDRLFGCYSSYQSGVGVLPTVNMPEFSAGSPIAGLDLPDTTITKTNDTNWHSVIETGENWLAPEGQKVILHDIILRMYTDKSSACSIGVEVKSLEDSIYEFISDEETHNLTTDGLTTAFSYSDGNWSNKVIIGDDVTTTVTIPCFVKCARLFFKTGSAYTELASADYATTLNVKEIELTDPLPSGTDLYCYWENEPNISLHAGDLIWSISNEYLYKVITLPTSTTGTSDRAMPNTLFTHSFMNGYDTTIGYEEIKIGVNRLVEGVKIKIHIVPNSGTSATNIKLSGIGIGYTPAGSKTLEP